MTVLGSGKKRTTIPPELISKEEFDSGHGFTKGDATGSTWSDDTGVFLSGTQSLKVVTDGSGTVTFATKTFSTPIDLTSQYLVMRVRTTDPDNISSIQIFFGEGGFTDFVRFDISNGLKVSDEWIDIALPTGSIYQTNGSPDLSLLDEFRIRVTDTSSAATIYFDLIAVANPAPEGRVCIIFDDGYQSVLDNGVPIMDNAGIRGSIGIIPSLVGNTGYITEADLTSLQNRGWSINAHDLDVYTGATVAASRQRIRDIQYWMRERGYKGWRHFIWPNGVFDDNAVEAAKQTCWTARTINEKQETYPVLNPYGLRVEYVVNSATTSHVTDQIDSVVSEGGLLILVFHRIVDSHSAGPPTTEYLTSNFQTIIDHIDKNGVLVETLDQLFGSDYVSGKLDNKKWRTHDRNDPFTNMFEVTPSQNPLDEWARGFMVGVSGDVEVITTGGDKVLMKGVPAGIAIPISVSHILKENTTATDIVAGY